MLELPVSATGSQPYYVKIRVLSMTKPSILSFETYDTWDALPMEELFEVHQFPVSGNADDLPTEVRENIRAFAFKGHSSLGAEIFNLIPKQTMVDTESNGC